MNFEKIVVCPAPTDENGRIVVNKFAPPPHGHHHILGVYPDGRAWLLATIDVSIDPVKAVESAKHFYENMPSVEIDPEYYKKQWMRNHPEYRHKLLD